MKKNNQKPPEDDSVDIKSFFNSCDAWIKKARQKRFKDFSGYKLDRWVFQIAMIVSLTWLFYIAYSQGFELDYYNCEEGTELYNSEELCENPFFTEANWKNYEYLPKGEYGKKPGLLFRSTFFVPLILFFLAILLNHFWHNEDKK